MNSQEVPSEPAVSVRRLSLYARIAAELLARRSLFFILVLSTAVYGVSHAGFALAAGLLARALVVDAESVVFAGLGSGEEQLLALAGLGVVAAASKALSGAGLAWVEARLAAEVGRSTRRDVAGAVLMGHRGHDAPSTILATIAVRVGEVELAVAGGVLRSLRASAQLVPLAGTLIFLSAPLALGSLLVLGPFAWLLGRARGRLRGASERSQCEAEQLHSSLDELVGQAELWRSYGAGDQLVHTLDQLGQRAATTRARLDAGRALLSGGNEVLGALAVIGGIMLVQRLGANLGQGMLLPFVAVFFMAYRPLRDLGDGRAALFRGRIAWESLAWSRQPPAQATAQPFPEWSAQTLELREFGARDRGPVSSFRVDPGQLVVILGPTGAGKTTLLRALLGLESSRGELLHGDQELHHRGVGPEARPFAWVPQEAPIIRDTILENVALLAPSREAARVALERLGARSLSAAEEEEVGPGARQLSGGERRLVALARAIATELPVLLVDEPTVGLDAETREQVVAALLSQRQHSSLIVVTHDRGLAALADRCVELAFDPQN